MRLQQILAVATKRLFTRCENSSQNLGCSGTVEKRVTAVAMLFILGNQKNHFFTKEKCKSFLPFVFKTRSDFLHVRMAEKMPHNAQTHLPLKLDRLREKCIENSLINVTNQQNFLNLLKYLFHRSKTRAETCSPTKRIFNRCENSLKNLGCSKASKSQSW